MSSPDVFDSHACDLESILVLSKTEEGKDTFTGLLKEKQSDTKIIAFLNRSRNPTVNIRITPLSDERKIINATMEILLSKKALSLIQNRRTPHIARYVTSIHCDNLSKSLIEGEYYPLRARKFSQTTAPNPIDLFVTHKTKEAAVLITEGKGVDFMFDLTPEEFLDIFFQVSYTLRELLSVNIRTNGVSLDQIKVITLDPNSQLYYFLENNKVYRNLNPRKLHIKINAFYDGTLCEVCENERFDLDFFIRSCQENIRKFSSPQTREIIRNLPTRMTFADHVAMGTFNLFDISDLRRQDFPTRYYNKGTPDLIFEGGVYFSSKLTSDPIDFVNRLAQAKRVQPNVVLTSLDNI